MSSGRVKKIPPAPPAPDELVQARVSAEAARLLKAQAHAEAISVSAVVRRVLYRHLGLIKE